MRRAATWPASRRSTEARSGAFAMGDAAKRCSERPQRRFDAWRTVPAPRRGELVRLLGEELRAAKEPLARLVTLESGQDRPGGPRRGPGDDRHLRLRGRPVAPALRPDHRQRAAQPPDDGAMAPARAGAGHQRLQFPGRGVGVECGAGAGLRRSGDLEAEREDAAHRRSGDGADARARSSGSAMRPTGLSSCVQGGREVGEALVDDPRIALRLGDRIDGDGPRGRPARRATVRPRAARAGRQQCDDRLPVGRPRAGRAGDPVLGGGDGGPALHDAAPADRPRKHCRWAGGAAAGSCSRA